MPSYVVTGASRGLGFEFLRQLSTNPANTVIGLVRNKKNTEEKVVAELNCENIHILEADITDHDSLQKAAQDTVSLTNGSLDYIIANAALMSDWSAYDSIGDLANDHKRLDQDLYDHFKVNVIGNIHLFTLFLPLILNGSAKKVIAISSGMADCDLIAKYDVDPAAPYSISKAALNVAIAKFSAQYREQGVLFLAISPGVIDTGALARASDEDKAKFMKTGAKFAAYAPHFRGPVTPDVSVKQVLGVVDKASIDGGYAGEFISHLGNKQWL